MGSIIQKILTVNITATSKAFIRGESLQSALSMVRENSAVIRNDLSKFSSKRTKKYLEDLKLFQSIRDSYFSSARKSYQIKEEEPKKNNDPDSSILYCLTSEKFLKEIFSHKAKKRSEYFDALVILGLTLDCV